MLNKIVSQPNQAPTPQIQVFGGASIYEYGLAFSDTKTTSGHTFRCTPSQWPFPIGTASWFGCALPDGNFASGSMTLRMNETLTTAYQTSLFIWDVNGKAMQCIPVPTTTGALNAPFLPGNVTVWSSATSYVSGNVVLYNSGFYQCISANQDQLPTNTTYWYPVTSGAAIDTVRAVAISGKNYIFAVSGFNYGNWPIAVTSLSGSPMTAYGEPYVIMGFVENSGVWAFDPTHSYTGQQLHSSSAAGQAAFPSSTNQFGEQTFPANGPVPLIVGPQSGHLILGTYFYQTGTHSGALIAIDPATGVVKAFYQIPDCVDNSGTHIGFSVRDLIINPTSPLNDERFIVTPDSFNRDAGGAYAHSMIMEFSYDASGGSFTPKSPPVAPFTSPGQSYFYNYNLAQYDSQGNLWLPTHGGSGLAVFNSHEMHVYQASGGNLPTFESGGPAANWNTTQIPTILTPDFRFGSYAVSGGFDQSIDWDATNSHMILTTLGGKCLAAKPDASLAVGPNIVTNPIFATNTSGWNGFFTSSLAQTTNAAFILSGINTTGTALQLTAPASGTNTAATGKFTIIPNRNYSASAYFMGTTAGRNCTVGIWWLDSTGTLISTSGSPIVTDNTSSASYVEIFGFAPSNAVQAFLLLNISGGTSGEVHLLSNVFWQQQPATATTSVDLNKTRLSNGASTQNNKGTIIGGRLYTTMLTSDSNTTPPFAQPPQWLYSIDLNCFK